MCVNPKFEIGGTFSLSLSIIPCPKQFKPDHKIQNYFSNGHFNNIFLFRLISPNYVLQLKLKGMYYSRLVLP
jgi:hypothetical protein